MLCNYGQPRHSFDRYHRLEVRKRCGKTYGFLMGFRKIILKWWAFHIKVNLEEAMFLIFFSQPSARANLNPLSCGGVTFGRWLNPHDLGMVMLPALQRNFFCRVPRFKVALVMNQSNYQRFKPNRTGTVVAKR